MLPFQGAQRLNPAAVRPGTESLTKK